MTGIYLDKWITANKLPPRLGLYLLAAGYLVTAVGAAFILPNMSNELNCQLWFLMPLTLVLAAAAILFLIKKRKLFPAFVAAFAGLCLSATAFSSQIIPNLVHLVPTGILAAELNKIPPGDKLGVHESLLSWIDEITFQTNREPVKLTTEQLDGFLSSPEPALLIVSEDKLKGLSETTRARLNIICKRIGITHTLTPGYAIKCKGHLTDPIPVVLVSNH